jgi:hypothetical protein
VLGNVFKQLNASTKVLLEIALNRKPQSSCLQDCLHGLVIRVKDYKGISSGDHRETVRSILEDRTLLDVDVRGRRHGDIGGCIYSHGLVVAPTVWLHCISGIYKRFSAHTYTGIALKTALPTLVIVKPLAIVGDIAP